MLFFRVFQEQFGTVVEGGFGEVCSDALQFCQPATVGEAIFLDVANNTVYLVQFFAAEEGPVTDDGTIGQDSYFLQACTAVEGTYLLLYTCSTRIRLPL